MNPQLLQLLISIGGIAAMVGLCRLLFGGGGAVISDPDAVAASLARDVAGFRGGHVALSRDGRAALIENRMDGQLYLAIVRGDDLVTRRLTGDLRVTREGARLRLTLQDFTLPKAELDLADAEAWESRLKGLAG